jgi:hypothetical protein
VDLESGKLAQLKEIGAVPDLARATTTLVIRCKDDSKLLDVQYGISQPSAELFELSFKVLLALQNFGNVTTIKFKPEEQDWDEEQDCEEPRIVDGEPIDFTNTYSLVILAAQACGLRPHEIIWSSVFFDGEFKITTCEAIQRMAECFSNLRTFELCLADHNRSQSLRSFAKDLAIGLNVMQSLSRLSLDFSPSFINEGFTLFFKELVQGVHLP